MSSSSSKENIPSTTFGERRATTMTSGDAFGSSAPSKVLNSQTIGDDRYSRTPLQTSESNIASRSLVDSARSNTQSPMRNWTTKRKRTVTEAVQGEQESSIQHTPNPKLRKQVRHAVASPSQTNVVLDEVEAPPQSVGRSQRYVQDDAPMTPTRKGNTRGRSTELVAQSPHALNPNADYIPPSRLVLSPRGVSVRRRSVTPIPPYEPPKEQYTPPREVVVSPPAADRRSVRRTTAKKKRVAVKTEKPPVQLWVKTEPPEIDLTSPAPPASPGDDPILLVGPPSIRVQRPSLPPRDSRDVSLVNFEMDLNLPENRNRSVSQLAQSDDTAETPARSGSSIPSAFDFSRLVDDDGGVHDNGWADSSCEVDFGTHIDNGNFANVDDGWSDSDSDNGRGEDDTSVGEGDFTGKFMTFKAPVKLSPPENKDDRMEKWARPISPHPKRLSLVKAEDEDAEVALDGSTGQATGQISSGSHVSIESAPSQATPESEAQGQDKAHSGYADKRGRRLTLTEVEAIKFGPKSSTTKAIPANDSETASAAEAQIHVVDSFEHEDGSLGRDESMQAGLHQSHAASDTTNILDNSLEHHSDLTRSTTDSYRREGSPLIGESYKFSARSASEHSSGESSQSTLNNPDISGPEYHDHVENGKLLKCVKDAVQDETMDNGASLFREPCLPDSNISDCETEIITEEDQGDDSDGGASDLSVVKVMSDDPMAAARAAAILKMHDYDMVARKLRRRKTVAGGVSKTYSSPRNMQVWRRRTVAGLNAEDALLANTSLPELLQKAEEDLRSSPARSRYGSVALSSVGSPQRPQWNDFMYDNADEPGLREWSKADWKLLDSCFTDERYDLAEQLGLDPGCLANVEDVPLECVVQRFIMLMGDVEKVESHGPSWTTEKLMARAKALCKRQRAGQGAPPTPDVSARFATPSRFSTLSPPPDMMVPDFTPLGAERTRLFDFGSVSRKARLPPPSSEAFFKVPSSLPARHSRLRQDVTSTVLETPMPSRALDLFGFATPARGDLQQQGDDSDDESVAQEVDEMLTPIAVSRIRQPRPESAVKRSLHYISSWLKPDMYKSKKEERKGLQLPGLPAPPSDILSKSRGPVETPAPKPATKPVPHKDLISLEHVPPPQPSKIPRPRKPRRLVDLTHIPTPQPKEEDKKTISRRSSTSSVKDLIKEFEEKERGKVQAVPPRIAELRRQASVGSLKGKGMPTWRP